MTEMRVDKDGYGMGYHDDAEVCMPAADWRMIEATFPDWVEEVTAKVLGYDREKFRQMHPEDRAVILINTLAVAYYLERIGD